MTTREEKAREMIFQRGGKWFFREPGFERYDGERLIETVPPQDFERESEADALAHAVWYLTPQRRPWFPPPPA